MVARHLPATPRITIGPSYQPLVDYPPQPFRLPPPPASPNCRRLFRHYPVNRCAHRSVRASIPSHIRLPGGPRVQFSKENGRMLIALSLKDSIEGHLTPLVDLATSKYTHFVYASAHLTSHSADTRPTNPSSASTCVSELLDASLPLPTQVGPSACTCVRPVAHPSTRRSAWGCSRPAGSHAVRARLPRLRNSYHAR